LQTFNVYRPSELTYYRPISKQFDEVDETLFFRITCNIQNFYGLFKKNEVTLVTLGYQKFTAKNKSTKLPIFTTDILNQVAIQRHLLTNPKLLLSVVFIIISMCMFLRDGLIAADKPN